MNNKIIPIFSNKDDFIEKRLNYLRMNLSKNLDNLPNKELPYMEPHLRALYFEAYFLLAEGYYNASLILSSILLESLIKEKLFIEKVSDEELEKMSFGEAIIWCEKKKVLTDKEIAFFKDKNKKLRNPYLHYNITKLSEGVDFISYEIDNPVEKLIKLDEQIRKGELSEAQARQKIIEGIEPKVTTPKDFRPISQIAKSIKEEEGFALLTFLEIDKFIRRFAKKYFETIRV